MQLKSLEINGFKSFAKKAELVFNHPITSIVGPNGSGKSNVAESFRFVLGEQSIKSMRGKKGEDLIFNGGKESARANRASAKLIFDNSEQSDGTRTFNIDFDEVAIERVVHRDGVNEYFINGSLVRLKDVSELLAHAHIGASGHHIISQGEADRLLSATPKERKEMIEDALGLKVYQYKKEESEKKLEKTAEHIKEIELLRRELAPHLKFLRRQVEKIEKAAILREELVTQYQVYFSHESAYLSHEARALQEAAIAPNQELVRLEAELVEHRRRLALSHSETEAGGKTTVLLNLENTLRTVRADKDRLMREIGRLEGEVSYLRKLIDKKKKEASETNTKQIYFKEVEQVIQDASRRIEHLSASTDIEDIKQGLGEMRTALAQFIDTHSSHTDVDTTEEQSEIIRITSRTAELEKEISQMVEKEQGLVTEYNVIKVDIEKEKDKNVEAEKAVLTIMSRQNELHGALHTIASQSERLAVEQQDFNRELEEAALLVGRTALAYTAVNQADVDPRNVQSDRRRAIEKVKIRLEEMGGAGGEDVMKEFKDTEERDAFLARELEDLIHSSAGLRALIDDLMSKLGELFDEGIRKINTEFNTFFALMFGGGSASLELVKEEKKRRKKITDLDEDFDGDTVDSDEEVEIQEGVEIQVSLPHKRTKGLMMLSGGERALTSIALLFAMSQVNPPPFIILDETDAALDEANSRRYGDMIESLSKHSQLILITHNRETMSRAGVIYGVTMGKEGHSKLLSIAFDDALAVAK
jgi:chromosome segregation ATPase